MWPIIYSVAGLCSFLITLASAAWLRRFALRHDIVDRPDNARKIHTRKTPLLGGLALAAGFIGTILLGLLMFVWLDRQKSVPAALAIHRAGLLKSLPQLFVILAGSLSMVIVGLRDDMRGMAARTKLLFQVIIAAVIISSGIRLSLFIPGPWFGFFLTLVWIVGITNAFNLLDNMDALSCSTALISSTFFFVITAGTGQYFVAALLAGFIGALAGFLPFNLPPARMFLGDAGSLFIGLMLSVLTILSTYYTPSQPTPAPIIIPLVIMAIPIFDTASVMYLRRRARVSIFTADKNHLSHRLVRLGMTPAQAVVFIGLLNSCIGCSALLLFWLPAGGCAIVLFQAAAILGVTVFLEKIN